MFVPFIRDYRSVFLFLDFDTKTAMYIDTYDFVPPNWRVSFTINFYQFTSGWCKVLGNVQIPDQNGQYYNGNDAKRVATMFDRAGSYSMFQSPINNDYDSLTKYSEIQLDKVSIFISNFFFLVLIT